MKRRHFILLSFLFIYLHNQLCATHGMGADITYECIGNNQYKFRLALYRDCAGISAPASANIIVASSCASISLPLNKSSFEEASPLCPLELPNSTCNGGSLQGVEVHYYEGITTLVPCADWKASYTLCCRNGAITNSSSPQSYRMYVETSFDNTVISCNNSPSFTTPPIPYVCNNVSVNYNHGAIDKDGDSLAFRLVQPLSTASIVIPYNAGLSQNLPISTIPANNFNFNQNTGQMNFTPSGPQMGIIAVEVEEYRNGALIGKTRRDMQIVVLSCTNNPPNVSNASVSNVQGGNYSNGVFTTCPNNILTFELEAGDPDQGETVTIIENIVNELPGATVQTTNGNPATMFVEWEIPSTGVSNQPFSIRFEDDACPISGFQVLGFVIMSPSIDIDGDSLYCGNSNNNQLQLSASSLSSLSGTYRWVPSTGLSDSTSAITTAQVNGDISYQVFFTPQGFSCAASDKINIKEHPTNLTITSSKPNFCKGDTAIQFTASLNGGIPPTVIIDKDNYLIDQGITFETKDITNNSTSITLGDDQISANLSIGFNFNFYDKTYNQFKISSNGFLSFGGTSHGCCEGQSLPNSAAPNNLIAFAWEDLDPGNGGQPTKNVIRYSTIGSSPNRILVVEFFNVDHFSSGDNITTQIHLKEGSNEIEIHTTSQPQTTGNHTMGIENSSGSIAHVVSGRNAKPWSISNEAVRFTPATKTIGSTVTYHWNPSNDMSDPNVANPFIQNITNTTYTVTANDGICTSTASKISVCRVLNNHCVDWSIERDPNNTTLYWTYEDLQFMDAFIVERSIDGITFEEVGSPVAVNPLQKDYSFGISSEDQRSYYYRLKNLYTDQSYDYSCALIYSKAIREEILSIEVYPNPTKDFTTVQYYSETEQRISLHIIDQTGRKIQSIQPVTISPGVNHTELDIEQLSAGIYHLIINEHYSGTRRVKRLVVE